MPPDGPRNVVVNRAGMRLLFRDTKFGQELDDPARLHFELTRQLVNASFSHIRLLQNIRPVVRSSPVRKRLGRSYHGAELPFLQW
jgi:hypothetical protein